MVLMAFHFAMAMAQASVQEVTLANLDVTVWSPTASWGTKCPVLIFSHGFHGSSMQSLFLMEAFATAGYWVFAPNHHDAVYRGSESKWADRPAVPFLDPAVWSDATYRDRAEDIVHLITAIKADPRFRSADFSRLGLVGHSLGGYTVLGLAGAWPSWRIPSVKAVLALSPYARPLVEHGSLGHLSAPVRYQGGTRDLGTLTVKRPQGAYDLSPPPKYLVEFDGAGHFAWTNLTTTAHQDIVTYSLAFLNHYVKGAPADRVLTTPRPGVTLLRYDSELGRNSH